MLDGSRWATLVQDSGAAHATVDAYRDVVELDPGGRLRAGAMDGGGESCGGGKRDGGARCNALLGRSEAAEDEEAQAVAGMRVRKLQAAAGQWEDWCTVSMKNRGRLDKNRGRLDL